MKFNYLFVDNHNGHMTTYHPFSSNTVLTQDRVTKLLETIPGAYYMGTCLGHLLELLDKEGVEFSPTLCLCCNQELQPMKEIPKQMIKDFILLKGISGSY